MWFLKDDAPDNSVQWPIASGSKGLTSTKTFCRNIEREGLDILHAREKLHHYCFTHEVNIYYKSITTGGNFQEGCVNPVTEATKNPTT